MLHIKQATKIFFQGTPNEQIALDDINLNLPSGDFVTVIGSNGAGKSTLMNAIGGSFWLDKGKIILDGENITFLKEHERARAIGRLFQDPMKGTAPGMTIEENLALAYSRKNKFILDFAVNKKDREFFRESLASFGMGLEDRMNMKIGLLSGGQRQAVTLLMATINLPKLILLDEHTAALDPAMAEKVLAITKRIIFENKLTAMMITHNINSALKMGNRTIMMNAGKIVLDIQGKEREKMTIPELLKMYSNKTKEELDDDNILLSNF